MLFAQEDKRGSVVKTITVEVTHAHILKGVPRSSCRCPIALALRAAKYKNASVGTRTWGRDNSERLPLPFEAITFIQKYDWFGAELCDYEPFTLTLEVPDERA